MRDSFETIIRKLPPRLANRKAILLSAFALFALASLSGSASSLRAPARAAAPTLAKAGAPAAAKAASPAPARTAPQALAKAPGIPSAGGLPAQVPGGAIEAEAEGSKADADRGLCYSAYKVARGDTLSDIAEAFNVTLDTVVSFNDIRNARSLQPGRLLKVPSMSGILYSAKAGDTPASVAAANGISADRVAEVNGLAAGAPIEQGRRLFLPDARMASFALREVAGDLFRWPARGWISSWYGWRSDPFSGSRVFHNGLDIGVDLGTPVAAAMDGVVSETGYNSGFGNYVIVSHHAGWMSLYGHLQTILVKEGARVSAGQRIAFSGNTGYSTGPHLHFSVFKNGRTVNPFNVLR